MALATKPTLQEQQRAKQRIWKTPGSKFNWICLAISLMMYGGMYAWYLNALKTQPYAGPYSDPLRLFGIVAFCLVLLVAAYTLRRRFARRLPGKVHGWLWVHTWFGVISILIIIGYHGISELWVTNPRMQSGGLQPDRLSVGLQAL